MVRTIKEMLIKMLGHRKLKYVQLQTALCEIESIINNRPLTYVSEDDNDLKPLTPNEFLQNGPESSFPEFENLKPEMLHTRYRELGQLKRELKQRFLKEYLGALIQKSENIDRRQLKVGDVVLIGQENLKRMFWPKGRIVNLIPVGSSGPGGADAPEKYPTSSVLWTERRPRSILQAASCGRKGRLGVSHKQSLVDGKDVLEYPSSGNLRTERTPWTSHEPRQEEAKRATVLPPESKSTESVHVTLYTNIKAGEKGITSGFKPSYMNPAKKKKNAYKPIVNVADLEREDEMVISRNCSILSSIGHPALKSLHEDLIRYIASRTEIIKALATEVENLTDTLESFADLDEIEEANKPKTACRGTQTCPAPSCKETSSQTDPIKPATPAALPAKKPASTLPAPAPTKRKQSEAPTRLQRGQT
ncbi:hypothetical protein LAZ67_1000145 [Cordylochernes scorpioides]|uniref:DUF5641 domain-containing protein n=1 Tax=Cordylochernes scorpioides TaxID=51811 RepID=A0ABY6JUL8_9ARAC|nr:hypothetical protein LAZ67_1000145 [Cordylochernes scorpioides]